MSLINLNPTEAMGYARNRGESLYPDHWRGLVCACCPSLGVTGNTIRNHAGIGGDDGILTNMEMSDWRATDLGHGNSGYVLTFDGANESVNLGSSPKLKVPNVSVHFWHRPSNNGAAGMAMVGDIDNFAEGYFIGLETNRFYFYLEGINITFWNGYTVPEDRWEHVVATFDGTTQRVYLDGNETFSAVHPGSISPGANDIHWGDVSSYEYAGDMDDLRIYDRGLSTGEVKEMYNVYRSLYIRQPLSDGFVSVEEYAPQVMMMI